ncbi:jerky protein homolog-like [Stegodyphus dumicola]|uniref:jerky protein homolog-like n=1 Tax=Stegodyphus dumicola TaxID=202533 RepID=UPI0015AAE353|nr:jerky protein homolog-like [Stegodyphus dumicola]
MCAETLKERKNMKTSEFNEALYKWFRQAKEKGTPISGPILQEKALKFHEVLKNGNDPKFVTSTGWLDRWEKQYGVRHLSICGEKLFGGRKSMSQFKVNFQKFIKVESLTVEQLHNCGETGLNYKLLPTKSLPFKEEQSAPGFLKEQGKGNNPCSNATCDHKLKFSVTGKLKKPRVSKHIEMDKHSVCYLNPKFLDELCSIKNMVP